MSYNLLRDTHFETNHWKYINCEYEDGYLISNNKVFGIEQELILPDLTRLYFRCTYQTENKNIKDIKIGIQNDKTLEMNRKVPKQNKKQIISVVADAKQEKIKVRIIFESLEDINRVMIKEPLLVNLERYGKSNWLKLILDRTLGYLNGYNYKNEYEISELKPNISILNNCSAEKAKIGSIISNREKIILDISAKFIENKYYLIKLDFEEINQYGDIYFKYGVLKSKREKEQAYLVFKAKENIPLQLIIEPKEELAYKVNLKHLLLVDTTNLNLQREDIRYLPFI